MFFVLFFCTSVVLLAQTNQMKVDSVCRLIEQYFNSKDADKIYSLAGEKFKKQISFEQFKQICNTNLFPLGKMQTQFEKNTDGVSKYKAIFSSVTLGLYLSIDDKDKVETFLFKSYINEQKKTVKVPGTNALHTALDKEVDAAVQPYISLAATTGLSIGILKDGKTYFYGYGETAKGNKQIPDEHTLFEIGSIAKTFTSILLADAVNNGKIKLDDPVNKYLPDSIPQLQYQGIPVTIKMLSNHTSGIPRMPSNFDAFVTDPSNPYKNYGEQQLFSFYKNMKLDRKPGTVYEYSNLAAATLGVILEHSYKKSFEQLLVSKICNPLHMNDTRQFIRRKDSARFAKGYNENGDYNGQWDFKAFAAAGSIRSTAADMLLYAKANLGNAPSSLRKAIELTHIVSFTDGTNNIGLGWHYIKPGNDEILFHNGGTGGYRSYLGINLNKKFAVIILSNTAIGTEESGNELMKWLEKNH